MSALGLASRDRAAWRTARLGPRLGGRWLIGSVTFGLTAVVVALVTVLASHGHGGPAAGVQRIPMVARLAVSRAVGAADRSYWVRAASLGLVATNPAQGFHERFVKSGVVVQTGVASVGLTAREVRRGRHSLRLAPSVPSAGRNRVYYRRDGLLEWYANGPSGLEQGFTVATSPPGAGTSLSSWRFRGRCARGWWTAGARCRSSSRRG
jgi:hypothetical protein